MNVSSSHIRPIRRPLPKIDLKELGVEPIEKDGEVVRLRKAYPGAQGFVGATAGAIMGVMSGALAGGASNFVDGGTTSQIVTLGLGSAATLGLATTLGNKLSGDDFLTASEKRARATCFFVAGALAHVGMMALVAS